MNRIQKIRCPHCKTVNMVDISKELRENEISVYRKADAPQKAGYTLEYITVVCTNCKKQFKVPVN